MSKIERDNNEEEPVERQDPMERRALWLHFGDVLESIGCVLKCADRHKTMGEAAVTDESLAGFPVPDRPDPAVTP